MGSILPLKKVLVRSRPKVANHDITSIKDTLSNCGFKIVDSDPDFILIYGGDGTILYNERLFPQVPKLILKKSRICRKCDYRLQDLHAILTMIKAGKYHLKKETKVETIIDDHRVIGLNEIQIRTKMPIYALRFTLSVNGKTFQNLIGDGVVIASPFGSTGYYRSTGGTPFEEGIGISFNNLQDRALSSFVVTDDSRITIQITRGPAWVLADNNETFFELDTLESCFVHKSDNFAQFITVV